MNPKITISVDAKNKAIATLSGMVTVGSKVDVDISGITASDVPNWGADDEFTGKSLRFRVVDECGKDLVRFPFHTKTETTPDVWTVNTSTNVFSASNVEFNTDGLRKWFKCVPFNEVCEFGVILDSTVDKAQYATGRVKVRQWAASPLENPELLPDIRDTITRIRADINSRSIMPTTGSLDVDSSLDEVISKLNTLIAQLKGL